MKRNFEELEIWKLGCKLVYDLGKIFYNEKFRNYNFQDQIMRAAISITNNIAEGNERGSDKDFVKFLFYSKGSIGEIRSMLYQAKEFKYITDKEFDEFKTQCITLSTKTYNLIKYLKGDSKD